MNPIDPNATYYDAGGISTLDVICAKVRAAEGLLDGYQQGIYWNLLKYALRLPFKGDAWRDAEKLKNYATLLQKTLKAPPCPK